MKKSYKVGYALGFYGTFVMALIAAMVVMPVLGIVLTLAGFAWFVWMVWQVSHPKPVRPLVCHRKRDWNAYARND